MNFPTPYYFIDEERMLPAMERIRYVEEASGAKAVLALKCFSSWCVFDFMQQYMSGTTSSSLYEARLGYEKFGKENHGYSVAYSEQEIGHIVEICNKVIFNSISQLNRFSEICRDVSIGLRINPEFGYSEHTLSNTFSSCSRLGEPLLKLKKSGFNQLEGVMFHMNCDNADFEDFDTQIGSIEKKFGDVVDQMKWVSLGGGVAFTNDAYPLERFANRLQDFSKAHDVQVYLEPGEAAVTNSTSLVVSILDIVDNGIPTLIVDAGAETHLLDVLTYGYTPSIDRAQSIHIKDALGEIKKGKYVYRVSGRTCLSGDVFGHYMFGEPLSIGDRLTFTDVGGYSMVKKNFFNGIKMPSIYHRKIDGSTRLVREFGYEDFKSSLS